MACEITQSQYRFFVCDVLRYDETYKAYCLVKRIAHYIVWSLLVLRGQLALETTIFLLNVNLNAFNLLRKFSLVYYDKASRPVVHSIVTELTKPGDLIENCTIIAI